MSSTPTPLPEGVRNLFAPPFHWEGVDRQACHILDSRGSMAAECFVRLGECAAPRGWGRIQYLLDGARLHDRWVAWFNDEVGFVETDPDVVVAKLNAAWGWK